MTSPITRVPLAAARLPRAAGAGITHRGCLRERNEDKILTDPGGMLWAVADGMGGYGNGEVASDITVDCLAEIPDEADPGAALVAGIGQANRLVRARAAEPGMARMGATVVAAIIDRAVAHVAWAGDSRAYLLRRGRLRMLTHDHTVVQDLVDRGALSPGAAEGHPEAHIVTRAVGGAEEIEVDLVAVPLVPGDRLLLCSDGLPRCVGQGAMEATLAAAPDAEEACRALLREALEAGAPDNVSVIAVYIEEG